ncbi:MAG: IS701 family transposase, partial [Betaproteobacteria bacterium]|nr:IS701 family transposase [Betaproteobacteria bacterium]
EGGKKQRFIRVGELDFPGRTPVRGYLKGYAREVLVIRQAFKSGGGSAGISHLVRSGTTCGDGAVTTAYKKRWQVGGHESLKPDANLAKPPTRTVRTRSNHVFTAICAAFKPGCPSIANKLNPFALCRKLLINASRTAYAELQLLRAAA